MNKEFSFSEYRDLLLEHFNISSHWLHFLNFIDVLVFRSVSYDKLGFLVLMSQTNLSPFKKNLKIINFIKHVATKENIEENFWEMLEPNNHYLAISKLDKTYDILNKFNWFNLERLIYDLKKYVSKNNELTYEILFQNFILGHTSSQFDKNIKPFLIKFININYNEKIKSIEPSLSGIIYNIIRPRHLIYYNINTEEKLKQLIDSKINQIEEGHIFLTEVYDKIKNYSREEINDPSSNLYSELFPTIQNDNFKNKFPYIYRKLTYILEDYSDVNSLVDFCSESNMNKSMRLFAINVIKKVLLFDYKFNINNVDLNCLGFNTVLLQIKNTNQKKFNKLKIDFFINLCYFIIKEKTYDIDENLLESSTFEEELLKEIYSCTNFNILVDLACNFLNKTFNLNLETDFYRLLKN